MQFQNYLIIKRISLFYKNYKLKNTSKISLFGLTMISIGATIGSGIFVTPADTILKTQNYYLAILPWIIGGITSYCGAMTFAELGTRYPKAGGVYVYLKEAYGNLTGFLYGWIILFVVNTGALAALGIAFAEYMSFFIDFSETSKSLVAIVVIVGFSIINVFGVNYSEGMANLFTSIKVAAMVVIILIGLYFGVKQPEHLMNGLHNTLPTDVWSAFSLAFVGVFWSIGGWHHISYLGEEVENPIKNIPKALLYAILTITFTYILIIIAYMAMLPYAEIIISKRIAGDALAKVIPIGGKLVALFIAISIIGTIAIYTMSAPRIYFAMARDKIFFNFLANVHPKYKTPHYSILLQAAWAVVLVVVYKSFIKVITFVTFMDILFMAFAVISLFTLRKKQTNYIGIKVSLWQPILYLTVTIGFVLHTLFQLKQEALFGLVILGVGLGVYYWRWGNK